MQKNLFIQVMNMKNTQIYARIKKDFIYICVPTYMLFFFWSPTVSSELENTLKVIKNKIADLHEIEAVYKDIKTNEDSKNFYSYILQLFEEKAIKLEIDELKVKKVQVNEAKEAKAIEIKQIDNEIEALDERSKELYKLL